MREYYKYTRSHTPLAWRVYAADSIENVYFLLQVEANRLLVNFIKNRFVVTE